MKTCLELHTQKSDYNDGLPLSKDEREEYRTKVANILVNNPEKDYSSIQTGNMLVIAVRSFDDKIIVFEAQGYTCHKYRIEELATS